MMIKKIQLVNITTHKKTEVEFKDGINVLSGLNGSGKSTIVKMIGYVLFNHIPIKQSDFVRKNKDAENVKSGTVKVWFEANDRRTYSVQRTIGASKIIVKDEQTNAIIPRMEKVDDLITFLKTQFGVDSNYALETIFENAVGVAQGTFTTPFLDKPNKRKEIFDPILNVEMYEKIYLNFRNINTEFGKEIQEYNIQLAGLEGEIKQKSQLEQESTILVQDIKSDTELSKNVQKSLIATNNEYQTLKSVKEQLDTAQSNLKQFQTNFANGQNNLIKLEHDLEEATAAEKICQTSKEDYQDYLKIQKEIGSLDKQVRTLRSLMDQKHEKTNNFTKIKSNLENCNKQIEKIENDRKDETELKQKYDEDQAAQKQIQALKEEYGKVSEAKKQLSNKNTRLAELQAILKERSAHILKIPALELEIKQEESLNDELISFEKEVSAYNAEIATFTANKKKSKGGICPILNEPCQNIGEKSLDTYFDEKIQERTALLKQSTEKLEKTKKLFKHLDEKKKELDRLQKDEIEIKSINNQITEIQSEIQELQKSASRVEPISTSMAQINVQIKSLQDGVRKYLSLVEKINKELPRYQKEKVAFIHNMEECQSQITVIDNQIEPLKSVDAILTSKKESLETKQAGYIAFQNNLKVMQKLPRIQQDLTDTQILCNDLTDKIKKCASELQKLKEQFNSQRFQDLEKQKSELTNQLGLLQGKITQNSQQLKKLQAKLTEIQEKEADLQTTKSTRDELMQIDKFSQSIREIYHQAGPKITEALLNNINRNASEIYRELMDQPDVQLIWKQDYDVELRSATILVENARTFKQLSGGEQMAVALAIRLALLKTLSNLNIAFLDEPTTNLDVEKRRNLAQCVKRIKGFKQLFVISHDDTFNDMAQNVIRFVKTENDVTKVVQQ